MINGIGVIRYAYAKFLYKKLSPLAYTLPLYHLSLQKKINDFLRNNQFDCLHVHDMVIADAVFNNDKKSDLPLVLDLHENRPEIMKMYSHVNSWIGKKLINVTFWETKQIELIKNYNRLIVVTEEAKKDVLKYQAILPDYVYTVPNTPNIDVFLNYPLKETIINRYKDAFVILYLGSTGKRRGTETAIRSVKILKNKIANLKLVIVGNSRDDRFLKLLTKKLGVEDNVDFEGWQDLNTFPSYIKASNVCISPLLRNRHHDTTYANKLFQYMAMGKATVVSDCTAQANVVQRESCGLVHRSSDEVDLSEKIYMLFNNSNLCEEYGKNGRKAVIEKYNWKNTSKNLLKLYADIEKSLP
jgi:glycosyltransferase involved in cell wall biosynthesis